MNREINCFFFLKGTKSIIPSKRILCKRNDVSRTVFFIIYQNVQAIHFILYRNEIFSRIFRQVYNK